MVSPYWEYGGAEVQFQHYYNALAEVASISKISFISMAGDGEGKPGNIPNRFSCSPKVMTFRKLPFALLFYLELLCKVRALKPEVVYGYSLYLLPVLAMIKILWRGKVKVVYSERILNQKVAATAFLSPVYRLFDSIIVNSKQLLDFFSKRCRVCSPILINNKVEQFAWRESKRENDFVIGIPARLIPEKNQILVLKALLSRNFVISGKNIRVLLFGNWENESYRREIEYVIRCSSGASEIRNVIPIKEVYSQVDLIVLPSLYEGTSNVILECMLNKKNFLCSRIRSNVDIGTPDEFMFELDEHSFNDRLGYFVTGQLEQVEVLDELSQSIERQNKIFSSSVISALMPH